MSIPMRFPELIIHTEEIPEDEQSATHFVIALAGMIDRLAYSISAAIGLIEYCELQPHAPAEWLFRRHDYTVNAP